MKSAIDQKLIRSLRAKVSGLKRQIGRINQSTVPLEIHNREVKRINDGFQVQNDKMLELIQKAEYEKDVAVREHNIILDSRNRQLESIGMLQNQLSDAKAETVRYVFGIQQLKLDLNRQIAANLDKGAEEIAKMNAKNAKTDQLLDSYVKNIKELTSACVILSSVLNQSWSKL